MNSKIIGTGSYFPSKAIDNSELAKMFAIDDWIFEIVGIKNRYWSMDYVTNEIEKKGFEMATEAAKKALKKASISGNDIDTIILVTANSDYTMPNSAVLLQECLGIEECNTIELHAACAGALQALELADNAIKSKKARNILVCCFNLISPTIVKEMKEPRKSHLKMEDLLNIAMFGDGASAVIVSASDSIGIEFIRNQSIGMNKPPGMQLLGGGAVYPSVQEAEIDKIDKWQHDAALILEYGGNLSRRSMEEILFETGRDINEYDFLIFPQANPTTLKKDIDILYKHYGVRKEKIVCNVDSLGNTSTAGLFIALDELNEKEMLQSGNKIMMVGGEASKWLYGGVSIIW